VEVCIVFAPDELGDQGYADRVLKGMHQFDMQLSDEDYDRVQLRYIAVSDTEGIKNELHNWDRQDISPYNRCAYERRLLVLTDARLLPFLAETPLSDTDEVLVMNVTNRQFDQTAETAGLGSRLHLVSISAADIAVIVKKNNIVTVKVGVRNLIPRADFDRVMEERLVRYGSYNIV